jgi:hypothetical protein
MRSQNLLMTCVVLAAFIGTAVLGMLYVAARTEIRVRQELTPIPAAPLLPRVWYPDRPAARPVEGADYRRHEQCRPAVPAAPGGWSE